jgi:hypothetical protein
MEAIMKRLEDTSDRRLEDMSDQELMAMTVKDMLWDAHAPSANEVNDTAMLEEWCQRVYSLDPPHNEHLKGDLLYYSKVMALIRKRMQEKLKVMHEKLDRMDWNKVKDVSVYAEPEVLCFDMKFLTPAQTEAVCRLIDDDPDLSFSWGHGRCGVVTVASRSMISAMPGDQWEQHWMNLTMRLSS